jgi:hypothetical protein
MITLVYSKRVSVHNNLLYSVGNRSIISPLSLTGKSMLEALIFALTIPQYDERLFMKIENCKLRTSGEHVVYINCFFVFGLTFRTIFVHKMFS